MRGGEEDDSFLTYLHGRHGGKARSDPVAPALRGRADLRERDRVVAGASDVELVMLAALGGRVPGGARWRVSRAISGLEAERA